MRKIIIGLSGLLIVAFVAVKIVNAQETPQEVKKNTTEQKMDCGKCPEAKACTAGAEMGCDPAKCKEGKCDPAKCKAKCDGAKGEKKNCDSAKSTGTEKIN
jgi:uncharacterized low-complexity protein